MGKSHSVNTNEKLFASRVDVKRNDQTEMEKVARRQSRVDQDIIKLFQKLDELTMAINKAK